MSIEKYGQVIFPEAVINSTDFLSFSVPYGNAPEINLYDGWANVICKIYGLKIEYFYVDLKGSHKQKLVCMNERCPYLIKNEKYKMGEIQDVYKLVSPGGHILFGLCTWFICRECDKVSMFINFIGERARDEFNKIGG